MKSQLHAAFTMTETKYCMEMTNLQEIRLLNSIIIASSWFLRGLSVKCKEKYMQCYMQCVMYYLTSPSLFVGMIKSLWKFVLIISFHKTQTWIYLVVDFILSDNWFQTHVKRTTKNLFAMLLPMYTYTHPVANTFNSKIKCLSSFWS